MFLAADVVDRALGSGMLWAGLLLGIPVGIFFERMRRAWSDYGKVKKGLPGMRKTAWETVGGFVKFGALAAGLVFVSIVWLSGRAVAPDTVPAQPPSQPPSVSGKPR